MLITLGILASKVSQSFIFYYYKIKSSGKNIGFQTGVSDDNTLGPLSINSSVA